MSAPSRDTAALAASPPFATVAPLLARLPARTFPTVEHLNALARERGLRSGGGAPIEFVHAGAARDYEVTIYREGRVPTRPGNWHDLFNALAWLTFPRTKATLNRLHYEAIVRSPAPRLRGTARDVLTLFDEGGVIVACAEPELAALLAAFQWKQLFWWRRDEVRSAMRFLVFGHAIHEQALAPYKGVTAKALVAPVGAAALAAPPEALLARLDAHAAAHFTRPEALASTRSLHPLPVLGIPGWTSANEDPAFYDDPAVFRSGRRAAGRAAPGTGALARVS